MPADIIVFNGYKFRLSGNYYRKSSWNQKGPSNLHRAVWEFYNGPIPEGYEIHHKDENGLNNEIDNLEKRLLRQRAVGLVKDISLLARSRAAEWHKSEVGRKWHSENSKKLWQSKPLYECTCQECGQRFMSPFPSRAKFCHPNCKAVALRRRRGWGNVGLRPNRRKPRLLSGKRNVGEQ